MQVKSRMRGAAAFIVVLASVGVGAFSQAGPAAAASATPSGPGGTWGQALPVPGVSALAPGGNPLQDDGRATAISCTSPGECTAVGSYSDGATWPLVVSQSGGAWGQAEAVPGIAALSSGLGGGLTEISCASAGNCSAAGSYHGSGNISFAFLADEVDGTWGTVQAVPDAASLGTSGSIITAISCPSAGNCVAVGGTPAPFILNEVDGTWGDPLPVPGLASLGTQLNYDLESVSCADAGDCTAIGAVADSKYVRSAVVVTETGGTWNDATVLPGQGALTSLGSWGSSVSCPTAGDCTATGAYEPAGGYGGVWVADELNGSWGPTQALPAPLATTRIATGKLACATPGNCAVAGDYRDASNTPQAFLANEVNGTWQASQVVPGLSIESFADAVSCAAPGDCTATGSYNVSGGFREYATDEVNGTWGTAIAIPGELPGGAPAIDGLSCTAPGYCSAAGPLDGLRSLVSEATGTVTTVAVAASAGGADEQAVPVTVSVTSPAGGTPTGTVTVTLASLLPTAPACTATLTGGTGTCAFPTTGLAATSYQLTAIYNGDTTYAASASAATAAVDVTGIGLGAAQSAYIAGQSVTLSGGLVGGPGTPVAGAVIDITRTMAGSTSAVKSTVTTDASGDFTITQTPPAGTYTYTATYTSDNPGIVSSAGSVTVTVAARTYSGTIRLPKMGLCLDDRNNSSSDGAVVQVWKCNGSANQSWQVYSDGTIRHNGLCLDAVNDGTANGTKVQLWFCNVSPNQKWDTRDFRIHYDNPAADNEVLDDTGHGGNGTRQQIWTNLNGTNQYWVTS
jgi:hypothetical protein